MHGRPSKSCKSKVASTPKHVSKSHGELLVVGLQGILSVSGILVDGPQRLKERHLRLRCG